MLRELSYYDSALVDEFVPVLVELVGSTIILFTMVLIDSFTLSSKDSAEGFRALPFSSRDVMEAASVYLRGKEV